MNDWQRNIYRMDQIAQRPVRMHDEPSTWELKMVETIYGFTFLIVQKNSNPKISSNEIWTQSIYGDIVQGVDQKLIAERLADE